MNADAIVGSIGEVVEEVTIEKDGRIRLRGTTWVASTDEKSPIRIGEKVVIIAIDGVRLKVKRKEDK